MDLDTEKFSFGHAVMVETGIFVLIFWFTVLTVKSLDCCQMVSNSTMINSVMVKILKIKFRY